MLEGGYPAIYDRDVDPAEWLASYVAMYVERDVRQILNVRVYGGATRREQSRGTVVHRYDWTATG